jgi:uncharacterized protein GlcG (DUF336 family)
MNLDLARRAIGGALGHAASQGYKPPTVVVLDAGGHVVAERQDGSSNKRFEVAYGKASGALALGMGSRALMARAEQQPYFIAAVSRSVGALPMTNTTGEPMTGTPRSVAAQQVPPHHPNHHPSSGESSRGYPA